MKRTYLILCLSIIFCLSGCQTSDPLPEPVLKDQQSLIIQPVTPGSPKFIELATITLKYKANVDEDLRQSLREANYLFIIEEVMPTICTDVEIWQVSFPASSILPDTQNGYTKGNHDTSKTSEFDLLDFVERIEMGWEGRCSDF